MWAIYEASDSFQILLFHHYIYLNKTRTILTHFPSPIVQWDVSWLLELDPGSNDQKVIVCEDQSVHSSHGVACRTDLSYVSVNILFFQKQKGRKKDWEPWKFPDKTKNGIVYILNLRFEYIGNPHLSTTTENKTTIVLMILL